MRILFTLSFLLILCSVKAQDTTYLCPQEDLELVALDALNTKSLEFSPAYYGEGIVFVVAREHNRLLDRKTGQAYFDLMYSDIAPDGRVTRPELFSPNIRTQFHEGPSTFTSDQTEIFFTRSDETGMSIYHGVKGAEDWEQIKQLPFAGTDYSITHPALSKDGNWLVFSSDMPGGLGGMDLYVVERRNNQWMTPLNLGDKINSKGNEVFPHWHESGFLFFSSDGRGGYGGLDLYVTSWTNQYNFKGIQHLLFPYNSGRDDLGFIVAKDGRSGYFASDRKPTKGKDDLYRWNSTISIFCGPSLYQPILMEKEILVTNESGESVPDAYIWLIPMEQEGPSRFKEHFNTELVPDADKPGSFYLRWAVNDTLSIQTADAISGSNGRVNLNVDKAETYAVVVQHNEYLPYVNIINGENIPSYIRLVKAPDIPNNCFNTLFTVYNAEGTKRIENASIFLTSQCLPKPLQLNANEEGNAANCLPVGCSVKAEIKHSGYAPQIFTFSPSEDNEHWPVYLKSVDVKSSPTSTIATGTVIVLDNIYYDFNKSAIRKSDAGELNGLANILNEYPDLTIELTSHTDTRGSAEYNMELSQKRSESSKNYLVLLGVAENRIVIRAAGESMPRNHCTDDVSCTEAEHQFNRRTEVRIINPAQGMEVKYKQ